MSCNECALLEERVSYLEKLISDRWVDMMYWIRYSQPRWIVWDNFTPHQLKKGVWDALIKYFLENTRRVINRVEISIYLRDEWFTYRSIPDIFGCIRKSNLKFLLEYITINGQWNDTTYICNLWQGGHIIKSQK